MSEELMKPTLENPHYPCPVCLSTEDPDYWQKHLELARHAEIGRLITAIVDKDGEGVVKAWLDKGVYITRAYAPDGLGYTAVTEEAPTLLEALRTLAAEIDGGAKAEEAGR